MSVTLSKSRKTAADLVRGGTCRNACARDAEDRAVEPNDPRATSWSVRGALLGAYHVADEDDWPEGLFHEFLELASELGYDSWRDDDSLAEIIEKFDRWAGDAVTEEVDALMRSELHEFRCSAPRGRWLTPLPRWKRHCHCHEAGECYGDPECCCLPVAA